MSMRVGGGCKRAKEGGGVTPIDSIVTTATAVGQRSKGCSLRSKRVQKHRELL